VTLFHVEETFDVSLLQTCSIYSMCCHESDSRSTREGVFVVSLAFSVRDKDCTPQSKP
jgi:hypothetical protein